MRHLKPPCPPPLTLITLISSPTPARPACNSLAVAIVANQSGSWDYVICCCSCVAGLYRAEPVLFSFWLPFSLIHNDDNSTCHYTLNRRSQSDYVAAHRRYFSFVFQCLRFAISSSQKLLLCNFLQTFATIYCVTNPDALSYTSLPAFVGVGIMMEASPSPLLFDILFFRRCYKRWLGAIVRIIFFFFVAPHVSIS